MHSKLPKSIKANLNSPGIKIRGGITLFLFILILAFYTIYDNNRVITIEQTIQIENLPKDFEGFTILQISDLHERVFGDKQEKLLKVINSHDYDAIVFTGDILDKPSSTNYEPFYTLIEGISNKEIALFVPGNRDPQSFILDEGATLEKGEFIKGMEERGVNLLNSVQKVEKGNSMLYFTYFENSILKGQMKSRKGSINKLQKELSTLDTLNESDILIALNHYPIPDERIDYLRSKREYNFRNYDLIIAGHYHGGQFRVPLIGALFVPEQYYLWGGIFPPRDRVKGLWDYLGIKQYVSAGLGSSDAILFMKFRFLNTPEINVLRLQGKNDR
ncbi:metallophosphoesterase [Cytobacillus solani]|uniref:metallophosphoesterase n=1 Tax=Cytobacillus solani TaxID=1637975 RepID=UPI00207A9215|nr:metallophosphoesterase [Cytobacillus solani]USK55790.1 metallophosphoesterase [Cytobacillus solani]